MTDIDIDVIVAAIGKFGGLSQMKVAASQHEEDVRLYFEVNYAAIEADAPHAHIINFATAYVADAQELIDMMHESKCYDVLECMLASGALVEVDRFYIVKKGIKKAASQ